MNLQAGCRFDNLPCFGVQQNSVCLCGDRHEPILHLVRSDHVAEGGGVHVHLSHNLANTCQNSVLCGVQVSNGGGGGDVPLRLCGRDFLVVGGLPSAVRVVVVGVVHAVCLDGDARNAIGGSQQLPDHALRNDTSASDKLCGVIVQTVHHITSIGVVAVQNTQDFLTVFLSQMVALTEERHLGLIELEALTGTERSLCVKCAGHQRNAHALVATQPLQVETSLLLGGEQCVRCKGHRIGGVIRPIGGNRSRGKDFLKIQCHVVLPPIKRSR